MQLYDPSAHEVAAVDSSMSAIWLSSAGNCAARSSRLFIHPLLAALRCWISSNNAVLESGKLGPDDLVLTQAGAKKTAKQLLQTSWGSVMAGGPCR